MFTALAFSKTYLVIGSETCTEANHDHPQDMPDFQPLLTCELREIYVYRHPDATNAILRSFGHYTCAALFIENVCVQFRSDHTILFHSTSSSTSIKQYVQLRLVLENER